MKLMKVLLVVLLILGGCTKDPKKNKIEIVENSVYWVPSNPTDMMIESYNKVSENLENGSEEELVKSIAISFAADFFTFSNKENEDAVGGMTYFPENKRKEIKEYLVFYYYKNYTSISNQYGEENLPEVLKIVAVDPIKGTFKENDLGEKDSYSVRLAITYKDSTLPEKAMKVETVVTLVKYDKTWNVVEIK